VQRELARPLLSGRGLSRMRREDESEAVACPQRVECTHEIRDGPLSIRVVGAVSLVVGVQGDDGRRNLRYDPLELGEVAVEIIEFQPVGNVDDQDVLAVLKTALPQPAL
jgi:hypothetical protein